MQDPRALGEGALTLPIHPRHAGATASSHDWQVSTPSALRYFELLQAPKKEIVLLEGGHLIPFLQPQAFLDAMVEKVRPTAAQ